MEKETGIFLRPTSGLRRSASGIDVFVFNTGLISVGLAVAFNAFYLPAFYPTADVATTSLIATVLMLLAGAGFYLWSALMPRSGGNYVFVSRALHPLVGFVVSWLEVAVLLFYTAVAAALIVRIGIATILGGLGVTAGSTALSELGSWIGGPVPTFVVGAVVIVISSALLVSGMRRFFFVQKLMFATAIVGTVALLGALLYLASLPVNEVFGAVFPGYDVEGVIAVARGNGWEMGSQSLAGSLGAIGWPLLPLAGGVLSIGLGGEIQRVKRNQLVGIIGAIVFAGLVFALLGWLSELTLGRGLLGAVGFSAASGVDHGVPGGIPWLPFLASALVGQWWLALLIGAGFVAWIYLWIPGMLAYCNRSFLAWSLDRVGPAWLGTVSDARHTPTYASAIGATVAVAFLAAYVWIPELQTLVVFQILMFAWALSLLSGALLPFIRRRLYDTASGEGAVIRSATAFSILMLLGTLALLYSGNVLRNDPISAGHSPLAVSVVVGLTLSGAVAYLLAFIVRRSQGIDLGRSFKEIPVE